MIRHIVFFTAPAAKIDDVRKGLGLLAGVPHSRHFEIGANLKRDLFGNEVDLVVYAEFEDEAALAAYKAHPLYQASTAVVKPIREMRIAADFQSTGERPVSLSPAGVSGEA